MCNKIKQVVICLMVILAAVMLPGVGEVAYAASGDISTVAGDGTPGFSGDGGPAVSAQLNNPSGVAVDSSGNVYFADRGNNRIRKIDQATGEISTVAGNGLTYPHAVAVDSDGNLYIADNGNNRIRKVDKTTGEISTVAGNGVRGFSGDGGAATSAHLALPTGVAVDSSGNLYIADQDNNRIRKVDKATGTISTVAGNGGRGYSGDGGLANETSLNNPIGVAVDSSGDVYIADTGNSRIRKVDQITGKISTVAGTGRQGYSGDGGPATSAQLTIPFEIAVDASGNLYFADYGNNRIRKVDTGGMISTVAGGGTSGSGDGGPATSAKLSSPFGVAVDSSGNVYIGDSRNNRIRKVEPLSSNADLSGLTLSDGTLSPVFSAGTTAYTASVGNSVSSVTVTPTVSDSSATVKVNGTTVASGTASGAISLNVNSNTITVLVTAQDGTPKTYTVTVTRATSDNAKLDTLTVEPGTLSPTFSEDVDEYEVTVGNQVDQLKVTAHPEDTSATITINGGPTNPATIHLNVGETEFSIMVTAENGSTKTYRIKATRLPSDPPVAHDDAYSVKVGETLHVPAPGVLANDTAPDSTPLTAILERIPTKGTIRWHMDGSFDYTPNQGASGVDSFTYKASNGQLESAPATVRITITRPSIPPPYYPVTGVSLDQTELTMVEGEEPYTLKASVTPAYATNQLVYWSSSDPAIASIDQDGAVTAHKSGTAVITVTTLDGEKTDSCTVTVEANTFELESTAKSILLKPGESAAFRVFATYANGEREEITSVEETEYTSSSDVITVDQGRVEAGDDPGEAIVTIRYQDKELKLHVYVVDADVSKLLATPKTLRQEVGDRRQLELSAKLADGEMIEHIGEQAEWSTSNKKVAVVSDTGEVTAVGVGSASIRASFGGKKLSVRVIVSEAREPDKLKVNSQILHLDENISQQVTLTAIYDDGSTKDITQLAEWTSRSDDIARVESGKITGVKAGKTTVTAYYLNKKVSMLVYVETPAGDLPTSENEVE